MITLTNALRRHAPLCVLASLLIGCSSISSGGSIREAELAITPTESSVSFSRLAQEDITALNLTAEQLGAPSELERNEHLAGLPTTARRSLLIAEAWFLRAQNDLEVPLSLSLEHFLRSAHYSYEGIFGESGCEDGESQICKDLKAAYNRSVREIARLTNNGTLPPSPSESRYIVDQQADNDPLTLSEWEVVLNDDSSRSTDGTLGAAGTGCQEIVNPNASERLHARQCIPLVFIVTFDNRVTDERSRAHLSAINTVARNTLELHGRTMPLPTNDEGLWREIFTAGSTEAPITCVGDAHPALPTVLFLTPFIPASYEWPVIAAAVSKTPLFREHYNFCVTNPSTTPPDALGANAGEAQVARLSGALATLLPDLRPPSHIITIAQGPAADASVKAIKNSLKGVTPGAAAPLAISGALSFPAAPLPSNALPIPITSTTELSRAGSVALSDIKRMLTKLADPDDGTFGGVTRGTGAPLHEGRLSPVM